MSEWAPVGASGVLVGECVGPNFLTVLPDVSLHVVWTRAEVGKHPKVVAVQLSEGPLVLLGEEAFHD
jgi:hypothetical protein